MTLLAHLADLLAQRPAQAGEQEAVLRLVERYRAGVSAQAPALREDLEREAYCCARMPATSAAAARALELAFALQAVPDWTSSLDLGAGPGSLSWALAQAVPSLTQMTLLERDAGMIARGHALAAASGHAGLQAAQWLRADLGALPALDPVDIVAAAYVLSELSAELQAQVVSRAWSLCKGAVLLVETGTPRGQAALLAAREQLLALGAHLVGPCPHAGPCPMVAAGQWCHQMVRLARRRNHRVSKAGSLGFEDEPLSWLMVSTAPWPLPAGRVVARVHAHKGAVESQVCLANAQCVPLMVVRKARAQWKLASGLAWGDALSRDLQPFATLGAGHGRELGGDNLSLP